MQCKKAREYEHGAPLAQWVAEAKRPLGTAILTQLLDTIAGTKEVYVTLL